MLVMFVISVSVILLLLSLVYTLQSLCEATNHTILLNISLFEFLTMLSAMQHICVIHAGMIEYIIFFILSCRVSCIDKCWENGGI